MACCPVSNMIPADISTYCRAASQVVISCKLYILYISGWWYAHPSEKYECVSWDYYSQHMFQTTNQIFFYSVDFRGKMGYICFLDPRPPSAVSGGKSLNARVHVLPGRIP